MDDGEFWRALRAGDVQTVETGLLAGRDVNQSLTRNGRTALHLVSLIGKTGVVELLIQHDANLEARDKVGRTALHVASSNGQTGVVKLLIQHRADVQASDEYGRTALHMASSNGQTGVVELLIQHDADLEARDEVSTDMAIISCKD
ncbi:PREDICTED: uncharacterized protein LOC109464512 [Branchiostoma belcheri]|uniref:Uncharacterized protein LOC109464512 n=1 Tax=Branchiostoma belcheri TaxID=7741 RepID=A0A6P4XY73_BRABE|nr:PREDICTED: uncharacterized protein LOC109464512 [Branchiostoma belcheri]